MKNNKPNQITSNKKDLEYQILKFTSLSISIAGFFFLIVHTLFIYHLPAIILTSIAILGSLVFYYLTNKISYNNLSISFSLFLFIIITIATFLNGFLTPINTILFFIFSTIAVFLVKRQYKYIPVIISGLVLIFISIYDQIHPDYYNDFRSNNLNYILALNLLVTITLLLGLIIMVFIKDKYQLDRKIIKNKSLQIDIKNKELQKNHESLIQQHDQLVLKKEMYEQAFNELHVKNKQLESALEKIKYYSTDLEVLVEERTLEIKKAHNEMDMLFSRSYYDFHKPLASLIGLSNVAKLNNNDNTQITLWNQVEKVVERINHSLDNFRMISEVNNFNYQTAEKTSLMVWTNQLINKLSNENKNIHFDYSIYFENYPDEDGRNKIIGNMIENLIDNSIIFSRTEDNKPKIKIDIHEANENLVILVEDNGLGIEKDLQSKVFDMYFRGSQRSQGNGIGLYVVKYAVDKLNGKITLNSEENKYTQIKIQIPIQYIQ